MFEIKKEYNEYVSKTFRLPIEIIQRLEVEAQKNNTSLNKVVIQGLEFAIQNLKADTEEWYIWHKQKSLNATWTFRGFVIASSLAEFVRRFYYHSIL